MDNNNTALNQNVDLISTKGLDEMQREQAFKIAFNCFKAFYWGNTVISAVLIIIPRFFDENPALALVCSLAGIAIVLLTSIIYIIFAAKTSRAGAMNPYFLNSISSKKSTSTITTAFIIFAVFSIIGYFKNGTVRILLYLVFVAICYISHITTYFLAKKSTKLMNEETEE